ncbi:MAG: glycosyltransferase family 4 protein [Vulcanimicrobiaceae bacterium]
MLKESPGTVEPERAERPLTIFVPHASDYLTDTRPHGDGLVAFEVVKRLAARGHRVHVAAPRIRIAQALPRTLYLYPTSIPGGVFGRLRYMLAVRRLYARLRRTVSFDVVHQLNPVFTGVSLSLAPCTEPVVLGSYVGDWAQSSDTPEAHGAIRFPSAGIIRKLAAFFQQRLAAALLVTTPAALARIVEPRRHAQKTFEIPHGIDPAPFARERLTDDGTRVLYLGGLERRKGILVMLEAFALLRAQRPHARLIIGGDGSLRDEIFKRVAAMGLTESVEILGRVGRDDICPLLAGCSVFCVPSLGEPFGMSLLEAMATSKPVVVTDAGGPAHIVDPQGGIRVPPGDPAALAAAVGELLASPERRAAMGRYNRRRIEDVYAWDAVIARIEAVHAKLVAERQAVRS